MTQSDIRVGPDDFDIAAEIAALSAGRADIGAVASFVGLVRADKHSAARKETFGGTAPVAQGATPDLAADDPVLCMHLEHYPGMTERALAGIIARASARWPLDRVRVIHRVGPLPIGARIVFVGVASSHRGAAFAACEFIMDYLKTEAPFWKKEVRAGGSSWVDARESDDAARARWQQEAAGDHHADGTAPA